MAIAFDATSTGSAASTTLTVSHTCSGTNRALVVAVVGRATDDVTGVTYNGTAMTQIGKKAETGSRYVYLYYLNAPSTGANNIIVSATGSAYLELSAASYTGVLQTGQPEANATNSAVAASSLTTSITTVTDNAWTVLAALHQSGTLTAGSGSTQRNTTLVGAILDSGGAVTPAGSKSMAFSGASSAQNPCSVMIALAPTAADSISITTPVQYKVFQRSGSTGSISITGSYSGSPTAIEASFNGGSYSTIVASPSGGTFSGTLSTQTQGQGTLTVRWTNDTAINASVSDIGIGDVFVVAGDSISEGRGTNAQNYSHATLKATKYTQADAWGNGNDGIDTGTSSGSHWPLLASQIMADQSVPVAFISTGTGGTDVAGSANSWAKNNTEYAGLVSQVTDSGVNSVKACLFHLGPNAVVNASTLSLATYNTAIDTLASNIGSDVAGAPPICLGLFGEVNTGSPPDRRAAIDNIRGAIVQAWGDNSAVKYGPVLVDQNYTDDVHPKSDAELLLVAKRWWFALKETFYSGSSGHGPRLSSATWNVARDTLTVVFDRVLKTGLTFDAGAWIVKDNGTPMTISSIAYHGSNTSALVLTMSAAASGGAGTSTVTLSSGNDSIGLVIPQSADVTPATGTAIQLPAEPIFAATVAEFGGMFMHLPPLRGLRSMGGYFQG